MIPTAERARALDVLLVRANGTVVGVDDLPEALDGGLPGDGEWRVHVHLPVHRGGDGSTQPELRATLRAVAGGPAWTRDELVALGLEERPK